MNIETKFNLNQKVWVLKRDDKTKRCETCNTYHSVLTNWYVSGEEEYISTMGAYQSKIKTNAWYVDDIKIEVDRSHNKDYIIDIKYHLSNDEGWECQQDLWDINEEDIFGTREEAGVECKKRNLELESKKEK